MKRRSVIRALCVPLLAVLALTASAEIASGGCPWAKPVKVRPRTHAWGLPGRSAPVPYGKSTARPPKIIEVGPRMRAAASLDASSDGVSVTATAAAGARGVKRDAPGSTSGEPLLWIVKSKTATVYLFGSLHVADASVFPLHRRVEDAFHVSDTVVFESEVSPIAKVQQQRLLQAYGTYPPGQSLDQHVDGDVMNKLYALLAGSGLRRDTMLRSRPWYAALALTAVAFARAGFDAEHGMEEHFRLGARQKKVEHIEVFAQQAAVLRDMSEPEQIAALREAVERFDEIAPELGRAIAAWKAGDVARLEAELLEPMRKTSPAFYSRMMTERSATMATAVERYLGRQGTTFVVVGSGHLIGDGSVVTLLTRHGYRVERL
ncbi:MAG: TraB/GumN family protein [Deltaproteobacteria bacterium]|nr:TraB/GumN family protein [Deltaproteobacteria bacterium]